MNKVLNKAIEMVSAIIFLKDFNSGEDEISNLELISYEHNKQITQFEFNSDDTSLKNVLFTYKHVYSFVMGKTTITLGQIDNNQYRMVVKVSSSEPGKFIVGGNNSNKKYIFNNDSEVKNLFNYVHKELDGLQDVSCETMSDCMKGLQGYEKWDREQKINDIIE